MASNSTGKGSEFDPLPGKPLTQADRDALALRDACRQAGAPVPPVAAPYNGWDRNAEPSPWPGR